MNDVDRFLSESGRQNLVGVGLGELIARWGKFVEELGSDGYEFGLDDWRNDVDLRQILEEVFAGVLPELLESDLDVLQLGDKRFRELTVWTQCVWGDHVAFEKGWTKDFHPWYFRLPESGAELLWGEFRVQGVT